MIQPVYKLSMSVGYSSLVGTLTLTILELVDLYRTAELLDPCHSTGTVSHSVATSVVEVVVVGVVLVVVVVGRAPKNVFHFHLTFNEFRKRTKSTIDLVTNIGDEMC